MISAAARLLQQRCVAFSGEGSVAGDRAVGICSEQKAIVSGFIEDFTQGGAEDAYRLRKNYRDPSTPSRLATLDSWSLRMTECGSMADLHIMTTVCRSSDHPITGDPPISRFFSVSLCLRGEICHIVSSA
jgi:hypothetical protein